MGELHEILQEWTPLSALIVGVVLMWVWSMFKGE